MKNIMVPTDFGVPAASAFEFALDVISQSQGTIHLVHAIELPVMYDTLHMPTMNVEEAFLNELRNEAEKNFAKLQKKYNQEHLDVHTKVVFGPLTQSLLAYVDSHQIDLVIAGSHGSEGLHEVFIGSNAGKIVRKCHAPVLVIKESYKAAIKRIVVALPLDDAGHYDFADRLRDLQEFFGAHLFFVWIITSPNFSADEETNNKMDDFAKRYRFTNYTTAVHNALDVGSGIIDYAKEIKADIVAIETHGRTGLSRLVTRSITENVLNHYGGLLWTYSMKNEAVHVS